ncbi:hypothetical protein KRR26_20895 [Corallococcus sp. M34]|uniref:hypothetical protein n=1 Tax=Citreicoccus inhibens TaxID=2849499 RepID=UPI001C232BC6|nr:hypothetical protein [Citreicoccus inhibens]MBU8898078.1 hypothetical protein [Citreicoccus inhibens]
MKEGVRPVKLADDFLALMVRVGPSPTQDLRADAERRRAAQVLLGIHPSQKSFTDEERAAARRRHPTLFSAAQLFEALTDPRSRFLRTPELLLATGVAMGLEKNPVRLFERLMGIYLRTEKLQDEGSRDAVADAVRNGLATSAE